MFSPKMNYDNNRSRQAIRVREIMRVSAHVDKPSIAREIILEWLENEARTDLPEAAFKGKAFRHDAGDQTFTAVQAKEETTNTWALRFVAPDSRTTERQWTTEVAIRDGVGQEGLFSLRTLVRSDELKLRIQPTVPKFVEHIAEECGLEQGSAKIESDPWIVNSDYDAANLTEFLVDPDRRTPVFVLTVPEDAEDPSEPLLDPIPLQRDTLGIAKVIVLPAEFTWKLTNRFGKRLSVYRGAMRVYLTGFTERADPEGGHNLFMPHRMDSPESAAKLGSLLRWMAARESLRNVRLGTDILPFTSVLLPAVDSATASMEAKGASEADLLELARKHLRILRSELKLSTQILQWLTEENKVMEGRARESESKLRGSQHRRRRQADRSPRARGRPRYAAPSYRYDRGPHTQGESGYTSGRWARRSR